MLPSKEETEWYARGMESAQENFNMGYKSRARKISLAVCIDERECCRSGLHLLGLGSVGGAEKRPGW